MSDAARQPPSENRRLCEEFERLTLADPREAVAQGAVLLDRLRGEGDHPNFAYAGRSQVNALGHLGRLGEAIRLAAEVRRTARAHAPVEAARILIAAMHPRAKAGNLKGAMRAGERAAGEFAALGEDDLVARAELNLANVAKALGQADRSVELIRRVLSRGERIAAIRGQALNVLGEACVQRADFAGAREAFEEARAVCRAQGFAVGTAVITGNLADTAARAGDIEGALRLFAEARGLHAALGANAEVCRNALEEATLLEFAGLTGDALDRVDEARDLADRHGLAAESARVRLVKGRALAARGRWRTARSELDAAAARFAGLGDGEGVAQSLAARARCEEALGDPSAEVTARAAADAARSVASPIERTLALAAFARLAEDRTEAARAAAESIRIAATTDIAALEAEAHAAASRAALRAGRVADAVIGARTAFDAVARSRESLALARTRRAFLSRRSDIALALVAALLADGSADACAEAFDVLDRSRSLAITDALERSQARDPEAAERLRALTRAIDPLEPSEAAVAAAARADRAHERELLEARLRGAGGPTDVASCAAARAIGCPAIAFVGVGRTVHAIARYPDGGTRATMLASDRGRLEELLESYRFQIQRRLGARGSGAASARMLASARRAEHALAAEVFPAVELLLEWSPGGRGERTVVVLPGPILAGIPLAAIAPPGLRVAVSPSLAIAAMLDEPPVATGGRALVVSVADAHAPAIAEEGRSIAALLGRKAACDHLDGAAATIASVHHALCGAERAHIACHGMFPVDAPNLAGLRLSDGWYSARDAHALAQAPAELVLSGCATGSTADHDGEEWSGLVRGFAAAGTRRIVASLWQVDDSTTRSLMLDAYADPAGATLGVLRASRALRERGEHPAIASAFAIFGGSTAFLPEARVSSNRGLP